MPFNYSSVHYTIIVFQRCLICEEMVSGSFADDLIKLMLIESELRINDCSNSKLVIC